MNTRICGNCHYWCYVEIKDEENFGRHGFCNFGLPFWVINMMADYNRIEPMNLVRENTLANNCYTFKEREISFDAELVIRELKEISLHTKILSELLGIDPGKEEE